MIILIKLKRTRYDCADLHTVIRFRSAHVHKLGFQTRTVRHASIGTLQTKQLPDKEHESHTGKKKKKEKKKKKPKPKRKKPHESQSKSALNRCGQTRYYEYFGCLIQEEYDLLV